MIKTFTLYLSLIIAGSFILNHAVKATDSCQERCMKKYGSGSAGQRCAADC